MARMETDPDSMQHLSAMVQWIGSLYAEDTSSTRLREIALGQLDHMMLPPNGLTVQTALLAAIAVSSEDDKQYGRVILNRAIFLALEIRMNSREFANMERDPVLAESWRRTWWGLYVIDSCFAGLSSGPLFL
jgi:hypothetical protein